MIPNKDQFMSALRSVVIAVTTFAVGKGWISTDVATNIGLCAVPLALAIWGMADKTKAATVAKAADIVPISANAQAQVGIDPNNAVTIPTNPKQL